MHTLLERGVAARGTSARNRGPIDGSGAAVMRPARDGPRAGRAGRGLVHGPGQRRRAGASAAARRRRRAAMAARTGTSASTGRSSTPATSRRPRARPGSATCTTPDAWASGAGAHGAPEREVAAPDDDERRVGDLEHRSRRRGRRQAEVDDGRDETVAQRDRRARRRPRPPGRGPAAGPAAARDERHAGGGLDGQALERVGRRLRPGAEPIDEPGRRLGRQAEQGGLVAVEIREPGAAAPAQHEHAHAAASTDVPEPPLGDHNARSTAASSPSSASAHALARARRGRGKRRGNARAPRLGERATNVGIHDRMSRGA